MSRNDGYEKLYAEYLIACLHRRGAIALVDTITTKRGHSGLKVTESDHEYARLWADTIAKHQRERGLPVYESIEDILKREVVEE